MLRKIKSGFVGIEYCVIGAIIIMGCIAMFKITSDSTDKTLSSGTNNMGDNLGVTFTETTGSGTKIASLDVIPDDVSLKIGETKTVTTIISPNNVWNYGLKWKLSESDSSIVSVTPSSGTTEAILTGLSEGKALITVSTTDGSDINKDVIVRVGYPITEFSVVGDRVFTINEIGKLSIVFNDEDVSWVNKGVTLKLISESEFGGEADTQVGIPSELDLDTKVASFFVTEAGQIIIYPKQGGSVRFSVEVKDYTFETSYSVNVDISIQAYYYRYRDLADWSDWSETYVEGEYNEQKTQYGYQEVETWSDDYVEDKPSDGFYNNVTIYGYQTVATWSSTSSTTKPGDYYKEGTKLTTKELTVVSGYFRGPDANATSETYDAGEEIIPSKISMTPACHTHVATRTWYGSNDQNTWTKLGTSNTYKSNGAMLENPATVSTDEAYRYYRFAVGSASPGYKGYSSTEGKCTGTAPNDNGNGYEEFYGIYITGKYNQTVYYAPATWNDAVYDEDRTSAYPATTSLKPVSKIMYQTPLTWSEIQGFRDTTPYTSTQEIKAISITYYRHKSFGDWSEWFACGSSGCPESTSTRQVETRIGNKD